MDVYQEEIEFDLPVRSLVANKDREDYTLKPNHFKENLASQQYETHSLIKRRKRAETTEMRFASKKLSTKKFNVDNEKDYDYNVLEGYEQEKSASSDEINKIENSNFNARDDDDRFDLLSENPEEIARNMSKVFNIDQSKLSSNKRPSIVIDTLEASNLLPLKHQNTKTTDKSNDKPIIEQLDSSSDESIKRVSETKP